MSTITYRKMSIEDYEQVSELWAGIDGLVLSEADSQEQIASYLTRNEGLSFVGMDGDTVIATILCGHDGRRGFIYHVAVSPAYRGRKIGNQLVERSLQRLKAEGIDKCHLFVLEDNELGGQFWTAVGWKKRSGFFVYSKDL
ncbi:GNAT family N-acetyltransferase [Paenibacillus rigui]|uniref:GNAT family N-acetyltransferase n=1 Tax=Paenibacillus rigui TaxID=554312 RepID=A0A229UPY5_9BACL|nr:GNAT family N-acetyltransferase [Paenibacillus rigui]OXM85546.1 GNAT family N-acetyltransferase [Paenibacillus rigui]